MSTDEAAPLAGPSDAPSTSAAALAGAIAAAVALGLAELLAGTTVLVPSPIDAISQQVIPRTPEVVTRWAIATFGTSDIAVLNAGTTSVALVIGAVTGVAARRRPARAVVVFAAAGALGLLAARARSEAALVPTALVLLVAVISGSLALRTLLRLGATPPGTSDADGIARRRFLLAGGGIATAAVLSAATGRFLLRGNLAVVDPTDVALPAPARSLPSPGPSAELSVEGLSPLFTPNARFYIIDTAVAVPQIDPATWSLRIHGLVDREVTLSYDDLLARPLEEVDVTLSCVSNEVGGDLVGNARWLGVRLADLLGEAGVRADCEQLIGRSSDGFTAGFPVEVAMDGRDAIVAVAMNGEPLPTEHGFPARLVVPGLYGYVSATKWLTELELTTADVDGYWIPRGWSKEGPIKTQSRIDVPARGASVAPGQVVVAGVAWAPIRGIAGVEVAVDGGGWTAAELSDPLSAGTWVQWRAMVEVDAGDHVVQVRATDGEGRTQGEGRVAPAPDGAEGWHRVTFRAA
ncbi:MAG: molybdopterin-dependent oxidoreductase [Nitriliruptor sp.]